MLYGIKQVIKNGKAILPAATAVLSLNAYLLSKLRNTKEKQILEEYKETQPWHEKKSVVYVCGNPLPLDLLPSSSPAQLYWQEKLHQQKPKQADNANQPPQRNNNRP
ncbi:MAG: hypothetical protein JSS07_04405 [Proteobacteria bacterium]|nr:hypothetical protein [Pseudomonadota bacterium]